MAALASPTIASPEEDPEEDQQQDQQQDPPLTEQGDDWDDAPSWPVRKFEVCSCASFQHATNSPLVRGQGRNGTHCGSERRRTRTVFC